MMFDPNIFSAGAAKLLMAPAALAAWSKGSPGLPIAVEIQPSERCTHRCPDCQAIFSLGRRNTRSLAKSGFDLDMSLLDGLWRHPPSGLIISGNTGDPLLYSDIGNLLERALSTNLPVALISNGEELTVEVARVAVRAARGIRISLDAHDAESFRRTHGAGQDAWTRVLDAVRLLVLERTRAGLGPEDCLLGAGYLTDDTTAPGMEHATRLARSLGLDYIQFRPFHYRASDLSREIEACRSLEELPQFRVFASDQKYIRAFETSRSYRSCHGAWFYTVIDARGDLYVCCHHVGRPEARIGSLRELGWPGVLRSVERRDVIERFPAAVCVPLCRLHVHNEALNSWQGTGDVPPSNDLSTEVRRHACFL